MSTGKKSKLPDPSLMKLSDIQGELTLRRINHSDCFDRVSLETKLREAREAMAAANGMDRGSRRNAGDRGSGGGSSFGGIVSEGSVSGGGAAGRRRAASAAEDAIFSSASSGALDTVRTPRPSASAGNKSSGNPFRKSNKQQPAGGSSGSSFRNSSRGIGFGDANSYGNIGGDMNPRSGGGDGVRLGEKRTSYGGFEGGSGIGGNFGGGGASGGNVVGGGSSFRGGGSAGGSFSAGGVSIKGDSSIFSSTGFVGQGGSTNVFDGGAPSGGARTRAPPRPPISTPRYVSPLPPSGEPNLDWLVQDAPSDDSYDDREPPSYDSAYGDEPIFDSRYSVGDTAEDDVAQYYDEDIAGNVPIDPWPGSSLSNQYRDQGLDILSGGRAGFGAQRGECKNGGGGGGGGFGSRGGAGGDFRGDDGGSPGGAPGGYGSGGVAGVIGGVVGTSFAPRRGGARTSAGGDGDFYEDMEDECV